MANTSTTMMVGKSNLTGDPSYSSFSARKIGLPCRWTSTETALSLRQFRHKSGEVVAARDLLVVQHENQIPRANSGPFGRTGRDVAHDDTLFGDIDRRALFIGHVAYHESKLRRLDIARCDRRAAT